MSRVVILGAGISGLSLAWFLKKRFGNNISITVLEETHRTGGSIQTIEKDHFLFEQGPHSCRPKGRGEVTLGLAEELGLENQVITANPKAHSRYIYTNNALHRIPTSLVSFLFSPLTKGAIPALIRDLFTPAGKEKNETIYAFFARRFNTSIAECLVDSLVSGIYAGNIHELSLKSCFPLLHEWEQAKGSVIRGAFSQSIGKSSTPLSPFVKSIQASPIFSFKDGIETLTRSLTHQLDAKILLKSPPRACTWQHHGVKIHLFNQETLEADHVFASCPPDKLADLIPSTQNNLTKLLKSLTYASVGVVNLGYTQSILPKHGFGYLIPSKEKEEILGTLWDSDIFPEQNRHPKETRLTVMIGGAHHPSIEKLSEQQCLEIALQALKKHLNITCKPDSTAFKLAQKTIPQYTLAYEAWIDAVKQSVSAFCPRLTLLGKAFGGVSVNDCIANAQALAASYNP